MKKISLLFVFAIVISIAFSSCKKYDEGPSLSLRSKASRLAGEWKITKFTENGVARSYDANDRIKMDKEGVYSYTHTIGNSSITSTGTWKLIMDDKQIEVTSTYSSFTDTEVYVIKRLSNSELFLEQQDGSDLIRIEYQKL